MKTEKTTGDETLQDATIHEYKEFCVEHEAAFENSKCRLKISSLPNGKYCLNYLNNRLTNEEFNSVSDARASLKDQAYLIEMMAWMISIINKKN